MPGTAYFHIGSGKTGTSAIQVGLVRNRELLAKYGLLYPEAETDTRAAQGMVTSGNGIALKDIVWCEKTALAKSANGQLSKKVVRLGRDFIWTQDRSAARAANARLTELIESNADNSLVYSSERFAAVSPRHFSALCDVFENNGMQVKVIYYVRHLIDYALSAYNQGLKRHLYTLSFEDFVRSYRSKYMDVMKAYSNIIGRQNIVLRLYEKEKPNLVGGFLDLLFKLEGLENIESPVTAGTEEIVNRSLAREEMEIMLFVNRLLSGVGNRAARKIAVEISNHILYSLKPSDSGAVVTAEEIRIIEDHNRDVLDYVNDFAGGAFELKIKSDDIAIGERAPLNVGGSNAVYREVIASLIDQIDSRRGSVRGAGGHDASDSVRPNP
jgi:hypothetical protein